jgi:hypothetical protein
MGNAVESKSRFGRKLPAQKALAGIELQNLLPKAKVVYGSATGATEVMNLAYAQRLNLWGEGQPFTDVQDFVNKISSRGLAGMEMLSMNMKALGLYWAPSIDYSEVKYQKLVHTLTQEQRDDYDEIARGWQVVLANMNAALAITGGAQSANAKRNAGSIFWAAQLRFFNQIVTSMQMPTVLEQIKQDLAVDKSVVISLVNTNEAPQERELEDLRERGAELEEFSNTPKGILVDFLKTAFPTQQYVEVMDQNGNMTMEVAQDSQGNVIHNQAALKMKEKMS